MNQEVKRIDSSGWEYLNGQVKETLSWLSRHKWVVTGALLFVPAICWYSFIYDEKIPISIASPSVVASAPIIFSLMVVVVALLSVYSCIPIMVFFTPIEKGGDKCVAPKEEDEFRKVIRPLFFRWILIQISICLAFLDVGLVDYANPLLILLFYFAGISWLAIFLLKTASVHAKDTFIYLLSAPLRAIYVGFMLCKSKEFRAAYFEAIRLGSWFWYVVIVAILLQMIIVFLVFVSSFEGVTDEDGGQAYVVAFFGAIGFAVIQFAVMACLNRWWFREGFLKRVILVFFGIVVVLGAYPSSGSFMLGRMLQLTSSGARSCAVVYWTQAGTPVEVKALGDEKRPDRSRPLRILVEMDGYYIVRILTEGEGEYVEREKNGRKDMSVEFIPRTLVAGIDTCPPPKAQKQAASPRLKKQHGSIAAGITSATTASPFHPPVVSETRY